MSSAGLRIGLLYSSHGRRSDGVGDYTARLFEHLSEHAEITSVVFADRLGEDHWTLHGAGARGADDDAARATLSSCNWVIVQYSPFAHGRWGFSPWLLRLVRALPAAVDIGLMVHEPFVERTNARSIPLNLIQRRQLKAIVLRSKAVFVSIQPWVATVEALVPATTARHLPVASTLPQPSLEAGQARDALGIEPSRLVLATMSSGHESRCDDYVVAAVRELAAMGRSITLLDLGSGAHGFEGLDVSVIQIRPGFLPAQQLSDHLVAADVLLVPLVDGVSTRRTSVMAALAAGVAVIGTSGHLTDPELNGSPGSMLLTPVGDGAAAYAAGIRQLLSSPGALAGVAVQGRALYDQRFAWGPLTATLISTLQRSDPVVGSGART